MSENKNMTFYYWFGVFAICFICFQAISSYIRPNYVGENIYINYLLGIAPNFFPAIGIPALIIAIIMQNKKTGKEDKLNRYRNIIAVSISTTGLIVWEFLQSSSRKLVFDLNDILWTFLGSLIFIIIYKITNDNQKH